MSQPKPETKKTPPKVYGRTRLVRLNETARRLKDQVLIALVLGLILFPFLALAGLTADLPIRWFDDAVTAASLAPSSWITVADFWFLMSTFAMLLMARRYGAVLVAQAQATAWLAFLSACFGMIVLLAPQLTESDLPRGLVILATALSWYAGPLVGVHLYDMTRGGAWWRAPMFGGFVAVSVQTMIFFPIAYSGTDVPWGRWWIMDIIIKVLSVILFVGIYALLRRRIPPLPNLGGR